MNHNEDIISQFLDTIDASKSTRINYEVGLRKFAEFHGMNIMALLEEAEDDVINKVVPRRQRIVKRLTDYNLWLTDNYSQNSKHVYLAVVKSFYKTYGVTIPRIGKTKQTQRIKPENKYTGFDNIEISRHLKACMNLRDRALILLITSSGLAKNELRNLKRSDFEGKQDIEGITTFELVRQKTDYEFITFCTPEATRAIQDYLKTRDDDDLHLFVTVGLNHHSTGRHKKISESGWSFIFRHLSARLGFKKTKGQYIPIRSHNYRKFFQSTLQNGGCPIWLVDYWMAHKGDNVVRNAYHLGDVEKLKEQYLKFMHLLAIDDRSFELMKDDEVKRILHENKDIKNQLEEMSSILTGIMRQQNNDFINPDLMEELYKRDPELLKSRFGIDDEEYQQFRDVRYKKLYGMTETEHEKDNAKKKREFFNNLTEDEIKELLYGP